MDEDAHAATRSILLKNLEKCVKALLASSDRSADVVFENSIHLDRFCLALENVLRYGMRGM